MTRGHRNASVGLLLAAGFVACASGSNTSTTTGTTGASFVPAPHRTVPPLTQHDGGVMSPLTLVTITGSNDYLGPQLQEFGDALVQSQWFKSVGAEYGLATPAASLHVIGAPIGAMLTDTEVSAYVQGIISDGGPQPNGNTLYVVYLPDTGSGGTGFSGYHEAFPSFEMTNGDSFAVVQRVGPVPPQSAQDTLTITASHEILEASTDPDLHGWVIGPAPAQAWTASIFEDWQYGYVEVGDLCEGTRVGELYGDAGFYYQRIFSNALALDGGDDDCIPLQTDPYENVTVAQDWYAVDAGKTISIPLTGWSTEPTANWFIYQTGLNFTGGFTVLQRTSVGLTTTLGPAATGCEQTLQGMNNGVTGTLTIDVPPGAAPGDYAVFSLQSYSFVSDCAAPLTEDQVHQWLVGIYVP